MAGQNFERQENGLIRLINKAYNKNGQEPFTLIDKNGTKITKVIGAQKYPGRAASGSEPYTDVELVRDVVHKTRSKDPDKQTFSDVVNLSNKGESAPSVAGGGLSGLEGIVPGIGKKLFSACASFLNSKGHKKGSRGTDMFIEVDVKLKKPIIVGNENMGGPIDFMYVGPMDVKGVSQYGDLKGFPGWNHNKRELKVNGTLTKATDYADKFDIFYRIRKRRIYQVVDTTKKNTDGTHKLFVTPDDIALDKRTSKASTSTVFSALKYNSGKYKGFFGPPISKGATKVASRGQDPGEWAWKEAKGKREDNRRIVVAKSKPTKLGTKIKIGGFIVYGSEE